MHVEVLFIYVSGPRHVCVQSQTIVYTSMCASVCKTHVNVCVIVKVPLIMYVWVRSNAFCERIRGFIYVFPISNVLFWISSSVV